MFDSILFDLDGTLWDAVAEIARSWDLALQEAGVKRDPITVQELQPCMGKLLPEIGATLLPGWPPERQLELTELCCRRENEYLAGHPGKVYDRVAETLADLKERYRLFVVSNCQAGYIEAFFHGTGLGKYFTGYECAGNTRLPKSGNITLVAERYGLDRPVYVGDTALDLASAREAGIPFLHAAYGFGRVEGVPAVSAFDRLPEALERLWKEI